MGRVTIARLTSVPWYSQLPVCLYITLHGHDNPSMLAEISWNWHGSSVMKQAHSKTA